MKRDLALNDVLLVAISLIPVREGPGRKALETV